MWVRTPDEDAHTSMFERIVPRVGDWFCFPQSVALIAKHAPESYEHRWIVVGSGVMFRVPPVMLRSTQDWGEGIRHEAHAGNCGRLWLPN